MGVVYRARDASTGTVVAYKLLHESDRETVQRFIREAEILAPLEHPAIVRYVDHGTNEAGVPYLAMEWVEGETLHARLEREGVSIEEAVRLASRLASGLQYAHARGIVHRDIKPSNVLLRADSLADATIVDFGIARATGAPRSLTATGALVGTPAYMSPEQAKGERLIDARGDMFALGCVLYECLTGHKAFEGKHALALIAKVILWEPTPVRVLNAEIPVALETLVSRMLAKQPGNRPDDDVLIAELAALDLGATSAAPRPRIHSPAKPAEVTSKLDIRPRVSVLIATSAAGADGCSDPMSPELLDERRTIVAAAIAGRGVRAEVMHDGSVLVLAPASMQGAPAALLMLDCARQIGRVLPELMLAITTGTLDQVDSASADVFELTVGSLAKEAMLRMFATTATSRPAGAIRVDPVTEQLLADEKIVHIKGVAYLAGAG